MYRVGGDEKKVDRKQKATEGERKEKGPRNTIGGKERAQSSTRLRWPKVEWDIRAQTKE